MTDGRIGAAAEMPRQADLPKPRRGKVLQDAVTLRVIALIKAAHEVDGIVKGLPHPAWPRDPWAALQRLALALAEQASLAQGGRGEKPMRMLLSAKPLPR